MIIPDNIGEYTAGRVVKRIHVLKEKPTVGHIIGFETNSLEEVILRVRWGSQEAREQYGELIHPAGVRIL